MPSPGVPCPGTPSVSYGGNAYGTVQIGTQCWIAQNLNIGTQIDGAILQTNNSMIEKYCYNNLEANCAVYGGLYQWDELMNYTVSSNSNPSGRKGICPTGWHIPGDSEWTQLIAFLGGEWESGKMKETGTAHWSFPNVGATNSSGLTALPGGQHYSNSTFDALTHYGHFWSATEQSSINGWSFLMSWSNTVVFRISDSVKADGLSVRCIKD
jgi:uncharacterized protein (TIGR02145 family)